MEPFLLLGDSVDDYTFVDDTRPFRPLECSSKAAYGCGLNGDAIVQGLTLLVRLGRDDDPDNRPELCIRATDEVFRRVGLELDADKVSSYGSHTRLCCRILAVDGDVMVLRMYFIPTFTGDDVSYHLVYDSAAASLSLLPPQPPRCRHVCTEVPLKVKARGQDKYFLALMAERSIGTAAKYTDPVLCLWSPPSSDDDRLNYSKRGWDLKACVRVNATAEPFEAHAVFSCNGNAVWGDLAQGILYCSCSDLIDDTEPVSFKHVKLPEECSRTKYNKYDSDLPPIDRCRTMGCVGGSVWLVDIDHPSSSASPGETMVTVWTLDLPPGKEWSIHTEFRLRSLWELELFRAMGLPRVLPQCPILRQRDDGAIYVILREPYKGDGKDYAHLVCIDLSSRYKVRIRSRRRFARPRMELPVVLDPGFFGPRH